MGEETAIRLVISDFGGVICTFDYRIFCERLARRIGRDAEEIYTAVYGSDLHAQFEQGRLTGPEYHRRVMSLFGADVPYAEFFPMYGDIFTEIPGTCEMLRRLHTRYPLYLLSDTNEIHFGYVKETVEAVRLFDQCIVSYEVGAMKPEPRIYQEALRRSGLPAGACVFIDDRAGNVEGGEASGNARLSIHLAGAMRRRAGPARGRGSMTLPIEVLDGHMHLFTAATEREESAWLAPMPPAVAKAARHRRERYEREQTVPSAVPPTESVEEAAARWLAELDRYGVRAGVFLALAPRPETLQRFAALAPQRLLAFTFLDPWEGSAPALLEEDVLRRGFRGLKLYPSIQRFHAYDERAYPTYERAEALGVPIVFHFGVTLDYRSDLRFSNPLDLHAVARDFPDLPLIVAHAGAGFFRETLFLAYHCANVHVDTSGSGTWMRYLPKPLDLQEVLKRLLDVFGGNRVLFGTDSRHASEGYRHWLLQSQREALEALDASDEVRRAVLGGNMARLLRISW